MNALRKNHWRLGWIILVNGAIMLLLLTGPIHAYHREAQIFQALGTPQPAFSFWPAFFENAWDPIFTVIMLLGILAELRRSVLAPILNVVPFFVPLIWGVIDWLRNHGSYPGERSIGIVVGGVLFLIGVINAVLYIVALRRPLLDTSA